MIPTIDTFKSVFEEIKNEGLRILFLKKIRGEDFINRLNKGITKTCFRPLYSNSLRSNEYKEFISKFLGKHKIDDFGLKVFRLRSKWIA